MKCSSGIKGFLIATPKRPNTLDRACTLLMDASFESIAVSFKTWDNGLV